MGRFAVIGWGSLIWDLDDLAPHVTGAWRMRAGPRLPMEFSRVSAKRLQALAVCLDEDHGAMCATHVIASRRAEIEAVAADLAARERAPLTGVGAVCLRSGQRTGGRAQIRDAVAAWCEGAGWDGAVWTDLTSNFEASTGQAFSVEAGRDYLSALSGDSLDEAVRYIESAPAETDTGLRRALSGDPWWQTEAARLRSG